MDGDAQRSSYSAWTECWAVRRIRQLVPLGFKDEIKELSKLSAPVVIAQFMGYAVNFVSTVFCGHLGKTELAGVSLAISVINVTGVSIGFGLASACDTLISQTYGSGNFLRVGIILQRSILILLLACFPCWAILINTEPILLAFRQKPEVASLAQMYVKIFMPALPAAFMFTLESRYLQNQGIIWPEVITGLIVNLLNALINYIVLFVLKMGVWGSAIANTLSVFSLAGFLYAYIIWKGLHKTTWGGWSKECLCDWKSYIYLAIPGMVMMCIEWWTFEIGVFLAGLISEVELGTQSVVFQLSNIAYMFPLGFSIAGNVRVGNALGAGETEQAKLSAKTTMFCAVLIGSLKDHISYIFTYDEQIRERVAEIISFYAPFIFLDALSAACGGIIRGAGKQRVGAICYFLGYYGIGFPIGIPLMFAAKQGIKGLWTGLFTCVSLQCTFLIFYLFRMNWKSATTEAQIRAGVIESSSDTSPHPEDAGNPTDTRNLVDAEEVSAVTTLEVQLSYRSLVLRRGFALAGMLLILATGIIINLLVTNFVT
ncbi:multidrug and toxin extrusion protein 1 isoform X2 [Girardinichthys multiradiatus]|uniref:multidrug and toxin extrusion protein 1 isoform X2 n=1 Tax=Girardinichthys multiradiatus TaxID=208333 RepID=UPI001FAD331F|nr:multidrug and toxin extrusion protein 1 isoform X2 [Girardinichthys multiradiatus]